jgi:predicted transcriptional regulator
MNNFTFHRKHMTVLPTDLLLDPTISIEAKAFAGILRAISEGNHNTEELAILLNVPEEKIFPALSELEELGFLSVEEHDGVFQLNIM